MFGAPFYESKKLSEWIKEHQRQPTIDEERQIRYLACQELINKNSVYGICNTMKCVLQNHPTNYAVQNKKEK